MLMHVVDPIERAHESNKQSLSVDVDVCVKYISIWACMSTTQEF